MIQVHPFTSQTLPGAFYGHFNNFIEAWNTNSLHPQTNQPINPNNLPFSFSSLNLAEPTGEYKFQTEIEVTKSGAASVPPRIFNWDVSIAMYVQTPKQVGDGAASAVLNSWYDWLAFFKVINLHSTTTDSTVVDIPVFRKMREIAWTFQEAIFGL